MSPATSKGRAPGARGRQATRAANAASSRTTGRTASQKSQGTSSKSASRTTSKSPSKTEDLAGEPASRRSLRTQGLKTMRKLLDAAMVVFARRGYHAARVDDIVKLARTSHGTFYLYFSNKEDLLRALITEAADVVASLDTALDEVGPDAQGWREVRDWIEQFSDAWQRYAPVLRAWTDLVMSDAQLTEQAHVAAAGVASTLASRIAEAGPRPGIDPPTAAEAVVAMVDRFHYLRQFAGEPIDASALDTLATIVHSALFGGGGKPSSQRTPTARQAAVKGTAAAAGSGRRRS
jgi:AcrR family transcriptional regulator